MIDLHSISRGLYMKDDGIWYTSNKPNISYPEEGNTECFNVEDKSFWFQHRNNCITTLIQLFAPSNKGLFFDIGGGNGYVSYAIMKRGFEVVLVEPGISGAVNAKKRGINSVVCSTLDDAQFYPCSMPAIGLFDVIEHIKNDISFLQTIKELMIPGGRLYITVPAYSFLWSSEDSAAGHYRRYTIESISNKLKSVGFQIDFATYFFRILLIPIFLLRTIPSKLWIKTISDGEKMQREHVINYDLLKKILNVTLRNEVRNIQRMRPMIFGGSCLIVASY